MAQTLANRLIYLAMLGILFCVSGDLIAGQAEIDTAKGMMIAGVIHEKCTGISPPLEQAQRQVQRQYDALSRQGFSDADIRRGFAEGAIYAEVTYPRGHKPSKSECRDAAKIHKAATSSQLLNYVECTGLAGPAHV